MIRQPDPCPTCGQTLPEKGEFIVDTSAKVAVFRGRAIRLQKAWCLVLETLWKEWPRVVPEETLFEAIYWNRPPNDVPHDSTISVSIYKLRHALKPHGISIRNVHGIGYQLVLPENE